ncbi:MAG: O-antigen ligase family protein [Alteromonadaceae bacterium]
MNKKVKIVAKENNSSIAFFFLFLYTAAIFIRLHEAFDTSQNWVLIKVLAIITLIFAFMSQRPLKLSSQHVMLFLLLPVIIISAVLNGYGMKGVTQSELFIVSSVIPLFLYSSLLSTIKRHHIIMLVCIIATLFMVHNGHVQRNSVNGLGWTGTYSVGDGRIAYLGFFKDPNDIGMFLVMNLPLVGYFFTQSKKLGKLMSACAFTALIYGIYLTDSRGTMLGAVALIALYLLITKGGTKLILFCVAVGPALATLIAARGGVSSDDASASGRLDAWYEGIHMLLSHPVFGVGMGNFVEWHSRTAHNSYVLISSELGFLGYCLWAGALFLTVIAGYYVVKNKTNLLDSYKKILTVNDTEDSEDAMQLFKQELALASALFFSLVGFLITAFFLSRSYTLLLFVFLGMNMASHYRIIKSVPAFEDKFNTTRIFQAIGIGWGLMVMVYITLKVAL